MSRRWLIGVSVTAHLAVGAGLFVSGVWHIDRLHADPLRTETLLQPLSPPAPSGGIQDRKPEPIKPKVHVVKEARQPEPKPPVVTPPTVGTDDPPGPVTGPGPNDVIGTCTENCADTKVAAPPVCGDSSVDVTEQCDDGNTADGDGCSSTCRIEVKPQPRPNPMVAPTVLQGLRISGETQLHPDTVTQNQMMREGATSVRGVVQVCIATDGRVASTTMVAPTKFKAYDATLLSAVRDWRYRPYLLNGAPVPACSTVTFIYTIR
jgi:TonB family protein